MNTPEKTNISIDITEFPELREYLKKILYEQVIAMDRSDLKGLIKEVFQEMYAETIEDSIPPALRTEIRKIVERKINPEIFGEQTIEDYTLDMIREVAIAAFSKKDNNKL